MTTPDPRNLLQDLIRDARRRGADAADAMAVRGATLSCTRRLGKPEGLERAEHAALGLRVFIGKRQAIVSGKDWSAAALGELAARAVAMARAVPEDPYAGPAAPELQPQGTPPAPDLLDPEEPSVATLTARAAAAEEAALSVKGVTGSEGAEADWSRSEITLVADSGFSGLYRLSRHGLALSVLAGNGDGMERGYEYHQTTHGADLTDPRQIGLAAGRRAAARLTPGAATTARMAVLFDPRMAAGLLRYFAAAVNGAAVARKSSFLMDAMGTRIMAKGVTIVDDPLRRRGLASRPFDGEGLATARRELVTDGVLQGWLLDLRSARQLGLPPTGNARRGVSAPPSPGAGNLHMQPGEASPAALMADIRDGLYVTEVMGMGVNGVTGDYSQGAAGFRIRNGEIAEPVSELTVAGNLKEMFLHLTPANDLQLRDDVNAPTVRIDGMTVAGGKGGAA